MGLVRTLILGALSALVVPVVWKNAHPYIFPVHIYNHTPGPCRSIPGISEGSEDLQKLPSGLVLLTTGLRFQSFASFPAFIGRKGYMKVVDLEHPEKDAKVVRIQDTTGTLDLEEFNPHGMSIWHDKKKGRVFVFVVNHHLPSDTEYITRFEWMEKTVTLKHLNSFTDPNKMDLVNDVVATGENSFYYTNFLHHRNQRLGQWERLLGLQFGSVGYFDGTSAKIVLKGLFVPNGINISPDGKILYLAEGGMQQLNTYTRHPDNSLTLIESHVLHTSLDNIDVDTDGEHLWIGCHPYRPALGKYLQDPRTIASPSQVLRVSVKDGHVTAVQEVLSDDGRMISASTIAVFHQKTSRMLVGSVASTALYCDVKYLG